MYRFSMIALAVGALALISAGTAFAASHEGMKGLSISGRGTAGIGMVSNEAADTTEWTILSEAIINFVGKAGPVTGKFRLEANAGPAPSATSYAVDEGGTATYTIKDTSADSRLNNLRNQVEWAVTDAFTLTLAGSSLGFGPGVRPYGATTVAHFGSINPGIGDFHGNVLVFMVNDRYVQGDFKFGAMNAGLALTGQAVLSSLSGAEVLVLVPYFQGSFGAVNVDFYYATGSDNADNEATEMSLAGAFKAEAFSAALQFVQGSRAGDVDVTGINLGARFGGIHFHYISKEVGTTDPVVDLALGYTAAIADGSNWSVAYASRDNSGASTDTVLQFSVQAKY
jgi:hypothetical protein